MKKYFLLILVVLVVPLSSITAQEMINESMQVVTESVVYDLENGIQGYLARPEDKGQYPGLILIHEWWGLNDNIREFAQSFARTGYVALAVDLYNGQSAQTPDEARRLATAVRNNLPAAFDNLTKAVDFIRSSPYVKKHRIASVGWCFGGGWSYEMARNDMGVRASIMYYGRFSPDDDFSNMRALILGNFGEKDRSISVDSVREFQATLKTLNGDHEIYIYPNAGHAFANSDSANYNKEAADLAWQRTIAFLDKHLQ
ncbi:MAG: dienelactone hydrolase family protein [Spirochaetota bacterium]|nr:MAG: dienelactone hydrolase family protein [Spirochaetota bacterium]